MSNHDADWNLTDEASGWLVGGGIVTMALFPLAIPILLLAAVFALPLLLPVLALGLLVAAIAVPVLAVRALARLVRRAGPGARTARRGSGTAAGTRPEPGRSAA